MITPRFDSRFVSIVSLLISYPGERLALCFMYLSSMGT